MRITDSENGAKVLERSEPPAETQAAVPRCFVWDARGNGSGGSPTLTGDHENRVTDFTSITVYDTTQITCPSNYSNPHPGDPCHPLAAQQHAPLTVFTERTGALCANSHPGSYTGQDAFNDMLPVYQQERRYIVRRLTPLECCRLQGFPDWWEDGVQGSDSARYKMWGNGIALPCAADVLRRIAKELQKDTPGAVKP